MRMTWCLALASSAALLAGCGNVGPPASVVSRVQGALIETAAAEAPSAWSRGEGRLSARSQIADVVHELGTGAVASDGLFTVDLTRPPLVPLGELYVSRTPFGTPCASTVVSSDPAARGNSLSAVSVQAGAFHDSVVNVDTSTLGTAAVVTGAYIYADRPTRLNGVLSCQGESFRAETTFREVELRAGWNVVRREESRVSTEQGEVRRRRLQNGAVPNTWLSFRAATPILQSVSPERSR